MALYISSESDLTPKRAWIEVSNGGECPWVQIGNLYVSITFTGNESWESIAADLYKKGQRKFAVLSGRHGDQMGQLVDSNHKFVPRGSSAADTAIDPAGDQKIADSLGRSLKDIEIKVEDVGSGKHNTVGALQSAIKVFLGEGRVVILAWCYSLYAMKEGWYKPLSEVWPELFAGVDMVPVSWTARDWDWVSTYPMGGASKAAMAQARK